MKNKTSQETPNWFDLHGLGFLNLVLYWFSWHTKEDTEILAASKPATINEISDLWPRPWLYSRAFLLFFVSFCVLFICWDVEGNEEQSRLLPGLIIVGSLATPITSLIYFFELNKFRSLSLLKVLRFFLIGSIVSIGVTFSLTMLQRVLLRDYQDHELVYHGVDLMPVVTTFLAALYEEVGKTAIIFIFLWHYRRRIYIFQGLLIGACVGAGFAVFESAGYTLLNVDNFLETIFQRGLIAPVCHIAWGAIVGGGIMLITDRRLKVTKLLNPKFWCLVLFVTLIHCAWNYLQKNIAPINYLQLGVLSLFIVSLIIWAGRRQVSQFKKQGYLPVEI